ncbi:MAG: hypothetical protein AABY06_02865 [Nanoarchaeota archaeon]
MIDKNNPNKFGLPLKEEIYKEYINEFYIFHPIGTSEQYIGKIKDIDPKRGKITFNPYFGRHHNEKSGKDLYALIDKNQDLFWDLTKIVLEPTTLNSILYHCYLSNKEDINKSKPSFVQRFKLAYRILFNKTD